MGTTTYSSADWTSYARTTSTKSTSEIFSSRKMHEDLNPAKCNIRESRDSTVNPVTTPILVALDVTGSMGSLAHQIATKGLGQIFEELLTRNSVPGPQFAFMGIGDVNYDRAPLQVSQFESDTASLTPQLEKLYLEGGGGGNNYESYNLAWYFASTRIVHDAFEKRGKKGYLFTVGDEELPPDLSIDAIKSVFDESVQSVCSNDQLLVDIASKWNVFHIMIEQGSYMQRCPVAVKNSWSSILSQRAIPLSDINKLSEVIISTIEVCEGTSIDTVISSWTGDTSLVVANAIKNITPSNQSSSDVVVFD